MSDDILYDGEGQIGFVTFNRPKVLNAITMKVVGEFSRLLDDLAISELRCLIITGAGNKAFVAGADIAEMSNFTRREGAELCELGNTVMRKIESLPIPVIAAVNGFALGGGFEIALSCDLRLASENAVFALPEINFGIIPGYGGIQRLTRTIGLVKARELAFTANRVNAQEALAMGIVNSVHPQTELMSAAFKMAELVASKAPIAVRAAKKVLNDSIGLELSAAHLLEREAFASCFETEDQREAMKAFIQKRKPEPFIGA